MNIWRLLFLLINIDCLLINICYYFLKIDANDIPHTDFTLPEGYVPMAPVGKISDYVSMDCKQVSIESGTPSTDTRFSDIHLDRVCAYLTPSEDEGPIERPTRAYSVGSRPDGLREKIDKYV